MGSCNVNFTLRNYTIEIDNEVAQVKSYNEAESLIRDGKIRLTLNSTDLPAAVGLDSSHQLRVTVCHDVVCKTSNPPLTFSKSYSAPSHYTPPSNPQKGYQLLHNTLLLLCSKTLFYGQWFQFRYPYSPCRHN